MSKQEALNIIEAAIGLYSSRGNDFNTRGSDLSKQLAQAIKDNAGSAELKKMPPIVEKLRKLSSAARDGLPKLIKFEKDFAAGKIDEKSGVEMANNIVTNIRQFHDAIVAWQTAWKAVPRPIQAKVAFSKVYDADADGVLSYFDAYKNTFKPVRPATAAPAAKPAGR